MRHKKPRGATNTGGLRVAGAVFAAALSMAGTAGAQEPPVSFYDRNNLLVEIGHAQLRTSLALPRDLRIHRDHVEDTLPPGDPGQTDLDHLEIDTLELAVGFAHRPEFLNLALIGQAVASLPTRLEARLERQQANDSRPPATASYIYTEAKNAGPRLALRLGLGGAILLSDQDWWLELRGVVDLGRTTLAFEKGWTRGGADEFETRSRASALYVSPGLRASVGTRRWLVTLGASAAQLTFHHRDDTRLIDHTARGREWTFGFTYKR